MSGNAKITVYGSEYCTYCTAARMLLKKKGLDFEDVLVSQDEFARDRMEQLTGRHTVPQVVINDVVVGGFDELYTMNESGELDRLLREAPGKG